MLNEKMEKAVNSQINAEMYSSYLYMSMATWLDSIQLTGFAHWMKVQAQEEMAHALKFYNYVNERGGRVKLTAIDGPPTEWESVEACVQDVMEHEQKVTGLINGLMDLALEIRDHASVSFLQWFIDEQVEEEAGVDEVLGKIRLAGQANGGMFMLDKEMAARVFAMPVGITI